MNKIIGREREIEELEERYRSNKAEFVAIYGRRRVGKTFLVKELFQNKMTFYHSGLSPYDKERKITMHDQLEAFYASLMRYGMEESSCPKSWMEAFRMLGKLLDSQQDGKRQLVFIDELPWMDTPRSKFLMAFESFWNSWGAWHDNVMLVVCGSATSWMLDNLVNSKGGLYDRLTCQIKLSPFTLRECKRFFESKNIVMSDYDLVECYMNVGGIPYYLDYFKRGKSLAQNIDELFFCKNAKLESEFTRLFASLFINPDEYMNVVKLLAKRHTGFTRDEIAEKLGIAPGGTFSKMLETLLASDFITSYHPFGRSQKELRYKLMDSFCQFYLRFVEGKKVTDESYWQHHQNMPQLNSWRGLAFERVCFNHISCIKKALGVEGVASTESSWIVKGDEDKTGAQIDMLIIRDDRVVNLCEMKFLSKEYEPKNDDELLLRGRIATLQERLSFKQTIHLTLVTTIGLKQNAHSGIFQKVVTMGDLFG
jgi:AAA+ ATPase superfamily predicted ATPase